MLIQKQMNMLELSTNASSDVELGSGALVPKKCFKITLISIEKYSVQRQEMHKTSLDCH